MKREEDIRNKIERTLSVADRLRRSDTRPFFETRLEARLAQRRYDRQAARQRLAGLKPAWALALLAGILVLNAVVILRHQSVRPLRSEQQLQEFYQLSSETAYDQLTAFP